MAETNVTLKLSGQTFLGSRPSPNWQASQNSILCPQGQLSTLVQGYGGSQSALLHASKWRNLTVATPNLSPVYVPAPSEKGVKGFMIHFSMGGVSATVSKTAAAPIEQVKLLIQNQDEMLKSGRLLEPYKGIGDCFARTVKE